MKPNYRVDAYDRITARLRAKVEAERWTIICSTCQAKFDTRHFVSCPYCASRKHREAK